MSFIWVTSPDDRIAHYAGNGAVLTLCESSVGETWPGEPKESTRDVAGERCGECIRQKLVETGEIRMVRRTLTQEIVG